MLLCGFLQKDKFNLILKKNIIYLIVSKANRNPINHDLNYREILSCQHGAWHVNKYVYYACNYKKSEKDLISKIRQVHISTIKIKGGNACDVHIKNGYYRKTSIFFGNFHVNSIPFLINLLN